MDLIEQLKELSYQMMLNENYKIQIENNRYHSLIKNNPSTYIIKDGYQHAILEADKEGYKLSLQFNELLLQTRKTHITFTDIPDATYIKAENLLYKYDLEYPISWYIKNNDNTGINYGYDYSDTINKKHDMFLKDLIDKISKNNIDEFTYQRLILASEYLASHHRLLSYYLNNEKNKKYRKYKK